MTPPRAVHAVERLDLDGYLYFHSTRGELLRCLGRDDEARAAYRRALELATPPPSGDSSPAGSTDLTPAVPRQGCSFVADRVHPTQKEICQ